MLGFILAMHCAKTFHCLEGSPCSNKVMLTSILKSPQMTSTICSCLSFLENKCPVLMFYQLRDDLETLCHKYVLSGMFYGHKGVNICQFYVLQ